MSPDQRDVKVRLSNRWRQRIARRPAEQAENLRALAKVDQEQRRTWWRQQIQQLAVLAGEFPGRATDARIAAWELLAESISSGSVTPGGCPACDIPRLLEYIRWLIETLPAREDALYDWAIPQPGSGSDSPPEIPQQGGDSLPPPPSPASSAAAEMVILEDDLWLTATELRRLYSLTDTEVRYLRGIVLPIWVTRRRRIRDGERPERIEARHPYPPYRALSPSVPLPHGHYQPGRSWWQSYELPGSMRPSAPMVIPKDFQDAVHAWRTERPEWGVMEEHVELYVEQYREEGLRWVDNPPFTVSINPVPTAWREPGGERFLPRRRLRASGFHDAASQLSLSPSSDSVGFEDAVSRLSLSPSSDSVEFEDAVSHW
jgi:hypothetical protein